MRLINQICRFPIAVSSVIVVGILACPVTLIFMLFWDWDTSWKDFTTLHTDLIDLFWEIIGRK